MLGQRSPIVPPRAEDFAAQIDDDRVGQVEAARVEAVLDHFDDLTGDALAVSESCAKVRIVE
jgi:hypothetical protein